MFGFGKKEKYSYVFFNCDEWNSYQSMNPEYNNAVYRRRDGRRALWKKIKEELAEGNIEINESDLKKVREEILEGDPAEANPYIKYGCIIAMEEAA